MSDWVRLGRTDDIVAITAALRARAEHDVQATLDDIRAQLSADAELGLTAAGIDHALAKAEPVIRRGA